MKAFRYEGLPPLVDSFNNWYCFTRQENQPVLFRSYDSGLNWEEINLLNFDGNDSWSAINVRDNYPGYIVLGSVRAIYTEDGGLSWNPLKSIHVDQCIYVNDPNNDDEFYIGNDGGISKADWSDLGQNPINLNGGGYVTSQFYDCDINNNGKVLAGAQDLGIWTFENNTENHLEAGDGIKTFLSNQSNKAYAAKQNGKIYRYDDIDVMSSTKITPDEASNQPFHTRFEMNKSEDSQVIFIDGVGPNTKLYRSTDSGESWTHILSNIGEIALSNGVNPTLYYLNQSHPNTGFYKLENVANSDSSHSSILQTFLPALSGNPINCMTVNPFDENEVWIGLKNFLSDNKKGVFKFNSEDRVLIERSNGIPDNLMIRTLAFHPLIPGVMAAGTSFGMYFSSNSGMDWIKVPAIPNTFVTSVVFNEVGDIAVSTYGRGVYKVHWDKLSRLNTSLNIPYVQNFENLPPIDEWLFESTNQFDQISVTSHDDFDDYCSDGKLVFDCYANASINSASIRLNLKDKEGPVIVSFVRKVSPSKFAITNPEGSIWLSNNSGLDFTNVYDLPIDTEFEVHSINISSLARLHGMELNEWTVLKFQEDQSPGDITLIDNVSISQSAALPLIEDFGYGSLYKPSSLKKHWSTNSTGDGVIELKATGESNKNPLRLEMYGGPSQIGLDLNEARLYVDMYNTSDVILSFDWQSLGNAHHNYNGVFVSVDGENFTKIYDLNTDEHFVDRKASMNLTQLIEDAGLCSTGTTIIEFQHYGAFGPPAAGGLAFDNISVGQTSYTKGFNTLPINYQFEGILNPAYWQTEYSAEYLDALIAATSSNSYEDFCTDGKLVQSCLNTSLTPSLNKSMTGLDLSTVDSGAPLTLSFVRKGLFTEPPVEPGEELPESGLYLSDDGGISFIRIDEFTSSSEYLYYSYDLAEVIQNNGLEYTSTMVLLFQEYQSSGTTSVYDNLIIDNSHIALTPFYDGFSQFALKPHWTTHKVGSGAGVINTTWLHSPKTGALHLFMNGSDFVGNYDRNEAQLHIDVTASSNLQLSFAWKSLNNPNSLGTGVYLSDDNGISFVKVYDLNTNWHNYYYDVELNLTELMEQHGLCPTRNFIIKFQQFKPIGVASGNGITFDNIRVEELANKQLAPLVQQLETDILPTSDTRDYTIYPNPISGNSDLTIRAGEDVHSIKLFDIGGGLISEWIVEDKRNLKISSDYFKEQGVYILKIAPKNKSSAEVVRKVIRK